MSKAHTVYEEEEAVGESLYDEMLSIHSFLENFCPRCGKRKTNTVPQSACSLFKCS